MPPTMTTRQPQPHGPAVGAGPVAPADVESGELAELTQERPLCGPDPDEVFHRLSELMTWKIQGLLTPEQFENAKAALGL